MNTLRIGTIGWALAWLLCAISWAQEAALDAARQSTEQFCRDAVAGRPEQLYERMSQPLRELVDPPVLDKFCRRMRDHLGEFARIEQIAVAPPVADSKEVQHSAEVVFEKGSAIVQLTWLQRELVGFEVVSAQMENWFDGVDSSEFYQKQAAAFVRHFMLGRVDTALEMCHPELQKQLADGKLQQLIDMVLGRAGELKTVRFASVQQEITEQSQHLYLNFEIEGEREKMRCELNFQFVGMKGYLVGFNFE